MVRCLRPGGQLVVADLVANDDPSVARTQNQVEQLRDPSHARLLTGGGLRAALEGLGVIVTGVDARKTERPLAPWLVQTRASEGVTDQITAALRGEINGGPLTGFAPCEQDGKLSFVQHFVSVIGNKPKRVGIADNPSPGNS